MVELIDCSYLSWMAFALAIIAGIVSEIIDEPRIIKWQFCSAMLLLIAIFLSSHANIS
jgi:hypothetical protein